MRPTSKADPTNRSWYRDWLALLLIGSAIYGILCVVSLASDIGRPFPGFITYVDSISTRLDIEWNVPSWWWIGTGDHPAVSDILISINGELVESLDSFIDDSKFYTDADKELEGFVLVVVDRDGEIQTLKIPVTPFSWVDFSELITTPAIIFLCLWVLAFILYRAASTQAVQRITAVALLCVGLVVIGSQGSIFQADQWTDPLFARSNAVHSVAFSFAGVLFLQLAIDFPFQRKSKRWQIGRRIYLSVIYTIAIIISTLFIISRFIIWTTGLTDTSRLFDDIWFRTTMALVAIATIVFLIRLLFDGFIITNANPRYKREARIVFVAVIIAIPALFLTIGGERVAVDKVFLIKYLIDARYFFLAIPFAFAAIALRYHTFKGAENWMLFVLLLTIGALTTNISMIALFVQSPQTIRTLTVPIQLILFISFFSVSLFWSRQNHWNSWLGRIFQWERVNYSAAREFGEALADASYQNAEQLGNQITAILCEKLNLECAAIWRTEKEEMTLASAYGSWTTAPPQTLTPPEKFQSQQVHAKKTDWLAALPENTAVILPLQSANQLLGALVVGKRWDSAVFDERDLEILSLIAQQTTTLLHNAQQQEALRAADKQMLQVQTNTQQKIARNLHDYILPALGRFPMLIESSLHFMDSDPEKSRQILKESAQQLQETAVQLRRIQQDLVIRPMDYGLAPYLRDLVQNFSADTGIPITLTLPPETDDAIPDPAMREAIYAVWKQALENAAAHGQPSRIEIKLAIAAEIHFAIHDNGKGASQAERDEAAANGRFGLRSMQTRLENVGGRFRFTSEPEQGATVEGWLPR